MSNGTETGAGQKATVRAEEMVHQWGEQLGALAATLGSRLRVVAARASEEAEDVWAEAQQLRHHDAP